MLRGLHRCAPLLLALLGCGDPGGGDSEAAADPQTLPVVPTSTAVGATSTSTSMDATTDEPGTSTAVTSTDATTGSKFDLGVADLNFDACAQGGRDCGCSAVDLLFIVDNSGSMEEHAPGVIAAFDPFIDEVVEVLPANTSIHVGVTRATGFFDPGEIGGWIGPACEGQTDGAWNPPTSSDNGVNGQQGRLFEQYGLRYFEYVTGDSSLALRAWFQGALMGAIDHAADYSNSETVVAAAAHAFHPVNAAHNAGFSREQAVLVLFLLSDSPDLSPANISTDDFVAMVRDAKAACGDLCVLTTGAIAGECYDQPGNTNTRLFDFMNGFGKPPPSWTPLQSGQTADFDGVLGAALLELIDTTCQAIPPN